MPSRLSSLVVRDGLVGVKRMEKAFQRQVIYGGSLDTILLEMNLIPEDRLIQYLALASGLPPAARDEGDAIDPEAVALISRELAEQYRAVPVAVEGDAVRVLVCSPLEIAELEDLADLLDRALQPLIVPEYRWSIVFSAAYGLDPPARYTQLARALDGDPSTPAVGRAKSVIITDAPAPAPAADTDTTDPALAPIHVEDDDADDDDNTDDDDAQADTGIASGHVSAATIAAVAAARLPPVVPDADTLRLPGPARRPADDTVRRPGAEQDAMAPRRRPTIVGVVPASARPDVLPIVRISAPIPIAGAGAARRSGPVPTAGAPQRESGPAPGAGGRTFARPQSAPISTEGRDEPLLVVQARELLATAEDRDTVFLTLLRAARSRARWAGLLTIQGGAAIGRLALAEPGLDAAAITTVLIPLDAMSSFRHVVTTHQPHIGPLASGDPSLDAMVQRMGGTVPPSALILPIVLRDRVVAVVVAHRASMDIKLADVTELLPMATAASDALGRLIVKHKAASQRAMQAASAGELEDDGGVTRRIRQAAPPSGAEPWAEAPTQPSAPALPLPAPADSSPSLPVMRAAPQAPQAPVTGPQAAATGPQTPIEDVLWAIESAREGSAQGEAALAELVARAPEAIPALAERFPGKLRVERFAVTGRALRAAQYGGLLEAVVRLGGAATDLLIQKLDAPQRDVRFYAAICAVEMRPRSAVPTLAERLFDQDYGVRVCALEALSGYPPAELDPAFTRARAALVSKDPEIVSAAAAAIVALGDVGAIGDLINGVERGSRLGEHIRRALVALTAQDFGTSERKWRKWWDGSRRRHRIEWLIDGLAHREDVIREAAIHDLRRLTGEYFGYHHDLPRREREAAAERWASWWRDTGQRRFSPIESERHRPTAKLPGRDE